MKIGSLLVASILLSGCISSELRPNANFDNNEYSELVRLYNETDSNNCSQSEIESIYTRSKFLVSYAEFALTNNEYVIYKDLHSLVKELKDRKNPSNAYCKIKTRNINNTVREMFYVFRKRNRVN